MLEAVQGPVLCGVDAAESAPSVMAAARATAERAGAPLLLAHVVTGLWDANVPGFQTDVSGPERIVDYGPPGPRLLLQAGRHEAGLIVLGTRNLNRIQSLFRHSVTRHVLRHASCPVMIVGPKADPEAPATGAHVAYGAGAREHATELAGRLGLPVSGEEAGAAAIVVNKADRDLVRRAAVPVVVTPSH